MKPYSNRLKRRIDLFLALILLVVLSPLFLLVAIAVRLSMGFPVFFRQQRPGRRGAPFELLKFRTMTTAHGRSGEPLPDSQRLTAVGRILRRWSLDELPELINVINGDMSLVGPRPLLMEYLARYTPKQARRHDVLPGITGWAQINGRNALTWEEKFDLDLWYVDHRSLSLDLRILLRTPLAVLRRKGISAEGHSTMPPFSGHGPEKQL